MISKDVNIYISYFHIDEYFKNLLNDMIGENYKIKSSPQEYYIKNNFNSYMDQLNSTNNEENIFIVLVGTDTYRSVNVDWELEFGLTHHDAILGLCLPTNDDYKKDVCTPKTTPTKLLNNLYTGYASYFDWTDSFNDLSEYINIAVNNKLHRHALI
ncbi:MAG: TIR domain-containing protein [Methanosphaera sp.]|nr:TIR domain-containing protein [Methanosphaera sp.]